MPLFLPPLLLAFLLLIFIPVSIRIKYGKKTEIQLEIQPIMLIFTESKKEKSDKEEKSNANSRETLDLIRSTLSYSKVTLSKLDISVFSEKPFSLYLNTAFLGASLYPLLSYIGLCSKKLILEDGALECAPAEKPQARTSIYVDVTLELTLYAVIRVITKHFLFKKRREKRARRNEGYD